MKYSLEVIKLRKEYSDFTLNDISFSVPNGSIMGIIGENGAGKSTTINSILNLLNKDAGQVRFWGNEMTDNDILIRENIGVVYDECNFHDVLNAKQISNIMQKLHKNWDKRLFENYLDKFSLPYTKKIKDYSKGMKMKFSIAVALSHNPKLLILDEATSGLDPVIRNQVLDVFLEFVQDEEHSILMSSHITSDLEKIADYITFIHQGELVFSKQKDELLYDYGIIRCNTKQFELIDKNDIKVYVKEELEWKALITNKDLAIRKYPNYIIDKPTIDDIMLMYIKGGRL